MKKHMLGIVLCFVMMFSLVGCEEEYGPTELQALATQQDVLQQQVDMVQAAATQLAEQLAISNIVDQEIVAKVVKLNKEADKIQAQVNTIALALKDVPLTGDETQDWIALLEAANIGTGQAGLNPYVIPIGAALSLLSGILALLAKRKAAEAAAAQLKYQAHKQGVERTMKEVSVSKDARVQVIETQLYDNIGEARTALGIPAVQ